MITAKCPLHEFPKTQESKNNCSWAIVKDNQVLCISGQWFTGDKNHADNLAIKYGAKVIPAFDAKDLPR